MRAHLYATPRAPYPRSEWAEALPESSWRPLPDLDLLRLDRITPGALHPLVCKALFPGRAHPAVGPPPPSTPEPVRVRCGGEWHTVHATGGALTLPHQAAEEQREWTLTALGGTTAGCFAAKRAWLSGTGRLPRRLRAQRRDLFRRVQHGDTPGVVALLDAGMDPAVRNGRQQTLLHVLPLLDHEPLLSRLLAAGLDLEARDDQERTPLHAAVGGQGSVALVRALVAAGAATDVVDGRGTSIHDLIGRRQDLSFLTDA